MDIPHRERAYNRCVVLSGVASDHVKFYNYTCLIHGNFDSSLFTEYNRRQDRNCLCNRVNNLGCVR